MRHECPLFTGQQTGGDSRQQTTATEDGHGGTLTALVGVTGAGKSTLMDHVLSGRKNRGYIEGDIFILMAI